MRTKQADKTNKNKISKLKKYIKSWSLFYVAQPLLFMGFPRSVFGIPSDMPLENMDFTFANWYQFQTASCLGVEPHFHFAHSELGSSLTCTWAGLIHDATVSEFKCLSVLLCLNDGFLRVVIHYHWLFLNLSTFSSTEFPDPRGEEFD